MDVDLGAGSSITQNSDFNFNLSALFIKFQLQMEFEPPSVMQVKQNCCLRLTLYGLMSQSERKCLTAG